MAKLRQDPPRELAGTDVVQVVDLADGSDSLPPTDGIALLTDSGDRVIIRPSGTEPKLKCYLEAVGTAASAEQLEAASQAVATRLTAMRDDLAAYFDF